MCIIHLREERWRELQKKNNIAKYTVTMHISNSFWCFSSVLRQYHVEFTLKCLRSNQKFLLSSVYLITFLWWLRGWVMKLKSGFRRISEHSVILALIECCTSECCRALLKVNQNEYTIKCGIERNINRTRGICYYAIHPNDLFILSEKFGDNWDMHHILSHSVSLFLVANTSCHSQSGNKSHIFLRHWFNICRSKVLRLLFVHSFYGAFKACSMQSKFHLQNCLANLFDWPVWVWMCVSVHENGIHWEIVNGSMANDKVRNRKTTNSIYRPSVVRYRYSITWNGTSYQTHRWTNEKKNFTMDDNL